MKTVLQWSKKQLVQLTAQMFTQALFLETTVIFQDVPKYSRQIRHFIAQKDLQPKAKI